MLETVPGVVITQHSGSGKANQYYARGFNLDHGTDFRVTVDGIDVNMPSHGHGQGYSDLNFLIPELVDSVSGLNKSTELGGFPDEERDEERASGPDAKSPGTGGHPNLGMKRIEPVRYAGREVERGP